MSPEIFPWWIWKLSALFSCLLWLCPKINNWHTAKPPTVPCLNRPPTPTSSCKLLHKLHNGSRKCASQQSHWNILSVTTLFMWFISEAIIDYCFWKFSYLSQLPTAFLLIIKCFGSIWQMVGNSTTLHAAGRGSGQKAHSLILLLESMGNTPNTTNLSRQQKCNVCNICLIWYILTVCIFYTFSVAIRNFSLI